MPNPHFTSLEQYRDIESICAYHDFVDSGVVEKRMMLTLLAHTSRDNARTPMQWNSRFCAGFSSAPPWISLGYSWRAVNVEQEEKDENSVLHFYRDILAFRKGNPLIRYGTFELLCAGDPHIFAYVRTYQGKRLLVICNFSEKSQNAAAIYPNPEAIRFHNYPSITPAVLRPSAQFFPFALHCASATGSCCRRFLWNNHSRFSIYHIQLSSTPYGR